MTEEVLSPYQTTVHCTVRVLRTAYLLLLFLSFFNPRKKVTEQRVHEISGIPILSRKFVEVNAVSISTDEEIDLLFRGSFSTALFRSKLLNKINALSARLIYQKGKF